MEISKHVLPRYCFIGKRFGENTTEKVEVGSVFTQKQIILIKWIFKHYRL